MPEGSFGWTGAMLGASQVWATDRSRLWRLEVHGIRQVVPVPSLLGAVVAKASALLNASDRDPRRHLSDLAFLAEVATRADLAESLTPRQASRVLEALDRIDRPGTEVARLRMAVERALRAVHGDEN